MPTFAETCPSGYWAAGQEVDSDSAITAGVNKALSIDAGNNILKGYMVFPELRFMWGDVRGSVLTDKWDKTMTAIDAWGSNYQAALYVEWNSFNSTYGATHIPEFIFDDPAYGGYAPSVGHTPARPKYGCYGSVDHVVGGVPTDPNPSDPLVNAFGGFNLAIDTPLVKNEVLDFFSSYISYIQTNYRSRFAWVALPETALDYGSLSQGYDRYVYMAAYLEIVAHIQSLLHPDQMVSVDFNFIKDGSASDRAVFIQALRGSRIHRYGQGATAHRESSVGGHARRGMCRLAP